MKKILLTTMGVSLAIGISAQTKGILYKISSVEQLTPNFDRHYQSLIKEGYKPGGTVFPANKKGWAILWFKKTEPKITYPTGGNNARLIWPPLN